MNFTTTQTAYSKTGFFSKMVQDYLGQVKQLEPFYAHPVSLDGIMTAIKDRKNYSTNRALLAEELKKQYQHIPVSKELEKNINRLLSENTFTITTAHQPNIFTGHLYFIYKILHAIKLAEYLKVAIPASDFVPVFYMGSEDADLDELGHVYINGVKHEWKTDQTGAVGRMKVDKALIKIPDEIAGEITIHPYGKDIIHLMKNCYTDGATIEQATLKMVNELFGEYGLIVLLPDNAALKRSFSPVVEKELTEAFSHKIVEETAATFPKEYKVQASGRELNLFYLKDSSRERIEKKNTRYSIINSQFSFSETEMMQELEDHPDRFSANVILRPVFQEMILPNIVFIGGGGEIAYWLELKKVFEAVHVPFPVLVLRNSFLIAEKNHSTTVKKLGFTVNDLFKSEQDLLNELVKRESTLQLILDKEKRTLQEFYTNLKATSGAIDITLVKHTEALHKKALDKLEALEKKMLRAEKRKFEAQQRQLHKLKEQLFPHGSLQERIENFMPFYAKWGKEFIDAVYKNSLALEQELVLMEEK
ncbi:MAG TPA: bacillithiol biosynthesis cysteine-adding enzyme BshC [Ferruginibacter sp.]|nr:bacillithiol biosynthesis cysteine-adding enzyme BshC [Ferruginibacter sp.]